jgi:hypothetical protein
LGDGDFSTTRCRALTSGAARLIASGRTPHVREVDARAGPARLAGLEVALGHPERGGDLLAVDRPAEARAPTGERRPVAVDDQGQQAGAALLVDRAVLDPAEPAHHPRRADRRMPGERQLGARREDP